MNTRCMYGHINDTDGISHRFLNTLQEFHIYRLSKQGLHMNETYTDTRNQIYDTIY
jgi:hypothetical protein